MERVDWVFFDLIIFDKMMFLLVFLKVRFVIRKDLVKFGGSKVIFFEVIVSKFVVYRIIFGLMSLVMRVFVFFCLDVEVEV